ncbi:MAG TPA: ABC transporter ATP-binding protein [Candidatus Methylomirabilis sp.]|nr:ABC transporter ATP-binding protein [Candidatus Methylomirabilis sp.]HSC71192.1 ABC transporter ATP-binding protein [Candidatus Methylomirabilis sp.]
MQPIIEAIDLVKYFPMYGGLFGRKVEYVKAVDSVALTIHPGETLGLVGESGCGKTTVGYLILNLLRPDRGKVLHRGVDITSLRGGALRQVRRNLQIVFQDPQSSLDPRMLIKKTVGYPLEVNGLARGNEVVTRVKKILGEVGLDEDHMYRYPHEFSGGQRQRIGIARALITGPEFIVFDEPTSALDVSVQAQILNLIKELQRRHGYSYLFISHNLSVVKHVSHRIAVMYLGKIVEAAPRNALFGRPLHPYTRALLASVPKPDPRKRHAMGVLSGDVPSPVNVPQGCRFHPRCAEVMEQCRHVEPPSLEVEPGHSVACHLYGASTGEADKTREG